MSALEIRVNGIHSMIKIEKKPEASERYTISVTVFMNTLSVDISRGNAHLLMLFLQEHLAVNKFYTMCQYCKKEHDSRLACVEYCEHDAKRSL